jgi:hypothetical protein
VNFTVPVALYGWPLVALVLCALLKPRRAVMAAYLAAWLFLPVYEYRVPGLPDWSKLSGTSISLVAGLLLFDLRTLASFRPRWFDLPMIVLCVWPFGSSIANNLGYHDGIASFLDQVVILGIPYFLGRIYFSNIDHLRELAVGLFISGVIYVPFCLYEIRMSPQLHNLVYGFHPHSFSQTHRLGGWRPMVFMDHGLMLGMWMAMSTLTGAWLYVSGTVRRIRGYSALWFLIPLAVTTILCKSVGSLMLLAAGLVALAWVRGVRNRLPLHALALLAPVYILVRLTGTWSGEELVSAAKLISEERGGSLAVRLQQEDMLSEKAFQKPTFGWGGWGRSRIRDEKGKDLIATDGFWIIEFGQHGLGGRAAWLGVLLMPAFMLVRRLPLSEWTRPVTSAAAGLTFVVTLHLIDCLPNAHITPVYLLMAGGLTGLLIYRYPIREVRPDLRKPVPTGSSPGSSASPDPRSESPIPTIEYPPHP